MIFNNEFVFDRALKRVGSNELRLLLHLLLKLLPSGCKASDSPLYILIEFSLKLKKVMCLTFRPPVPKIRIIIQLTTSFTEPADSE